MKRLNLKSLLLATSLSILCAPSWAQLSSSKLNVNSINSDKITAVASFPSPVTGDLYVAAQVGPGVLLFVGQGGVFSNTPLAYQTNATFSRDITVLDIPATGIPAGVYPLFKVVSQSGKNPLDVNNWIGGLAGLSQIDFSINLNNTPMLDGRSLFVSKGCSDGGCHGSNPADNRRRILSGSTLAFIKTTIRSVSMMSFLGDTTDPRFASDAELQAIADYLRSF